jgi:predicted PurR-regulated permease PerM
MTGPETHGNLRLLGTRTAVVVATAFAIIAVGAVLIVAAEVLLLVFAGLLFGVLLSSLADALVRLSGMGRGVALGLTVLLMLAATLGLGWALWPSVSEQADQLARELPAALRELRGWFEQREWGRWLLGRAEPEQMTDGKALVDQATGVLFTTISALAALVIILFVGLYVAAQPKLYHRGLRRLVPVAGRPRVDEVLFEVTSVLRWWLIGKILSMVLVGVLTTVGLWWLEVPLALTFGLLAAALTFIPNFGPILSVVPPALLALADDPTRAMYVVALYLAIQTVESYAVTPLIQRRTVSMPPALTIMSQLVLGVLVGGIGVAVATPLTAAAMTMVRMLYVEDLLEQGAPAARITANGMAQPQTRPPEA